MDNIPDGMGASGDSSTSDASANDAELVARAVAGHPEAFAELAERYGDAAFGAALHVLREPAAAAEVAQDALLRACTRLRQLQRPARFSAWLCRIAVNLALNRLQASRSEPVATAIESVDAEAAPSPSPEQSAETAELQVFVQRALDRLRDAQRIVFTLFHVAGYSEPEISEMLEIPVGTVKSRLSQARERASDAVWRMVSGAFRTTGARRDFWRRASGVASGRVVDEQGLPITGARIQLFQLDAFVTAVATTHEDGRWESSGLIPGAWSIWADHPDYVRSAFRRDAYDSVMIQPAHHARDLDFRMVRAAALCGRVLQADGSPAARAWVGTWPKGTEHGDARGLAGRATCDEAGQFEIRALPPGSYLVGAASEADYPNRTLPVTYHSGTPSVGHAATLDLAAGDTTHLELRLSSRGSVRLSVRVIDRDTASPVAGTEVHVMRRDLLWDMFRGTTNAAGLFETDALSDGPYQVTVGGREQGYPRVTRWLDVPPERATVEMEFALPKGALVRGRLVTREGQSPPAVNTWCFLVPRRREEPTHALRSAQIELSRGAFHIQVAEGAQPERGQLSDEGEIEFPPVHPGAVDVTASVYDVAWQIVELSVAGRLTEERRLDLASGEVVDGLTIVVASDQTGVVAGRAVDPDGRAVEGVCVQLASGAFTRRRETDRVGSFYFYGVPAGSHALSLLGPDGAGSGTERTVQVVPGQACHVDLVVFTADWRGDSERDG